MNRWECPGDPGVEGRLEIEIWELLELTVVVAQGEGRSKTAP